MSDDLTEKQFAMLSVASRLASNGAELRERMSMGSAASSLEGVHMTAASLVRRGYLEKINSNILGVTYALTDRGAERKRAELSLRRQS